MTSALLGLPSTLPRVEAVALAADLRQLWTLQVGVPPGDLHEDLIKLKTWFDPIATGERLRRVLAKAPEARQIAFDPLVYELPGERVLITPEGRAAITLLEDVCAGTDRNNTLVYFDGSALDAVEQAIARTY